LNLDFIQTKKLKQWSASIGDADTDELLVREDVGWGSVRSETNIDLIDLE
jgi:hypothetical protein